MMALAMTAFAGAFGGASEIPQPPRGWQPEGMPGHGGFRREGSPRTGPLPPPNHPLRLVAQRAVRKVAWPGKYYDPRHDQYAVPAGHNNKRKNERLAREAAAAIKAAHSIAARPLSRRQRKRSRSLYQKGAA